MLHRRKFRALEKAWGNDDGYYRQDARQYIDTLIAFDEVHGLGIVTAVGTPPNSDS